jgi:tRNA (Guanine37-N(1)-) methyltransferase (EC 2.1.1.31)
MHIDIISVLPELLESPFAHSIMKRAREKGLLEVEVHHLRKWAVNEYGQVDDYQYGGGAGMVMMCEPLAKRYRNLAERKNLRRNYLPHSRRRKIYAADGQPLSLKK